MMTTYSLQVAGLGALLALLVAPPMSGAQTPPPGNPYSLNAFSYQRPFASQHDILQDTDDKFTTLGTMRPNLVADYDRLAADRSALQADQAYLEQAEAALAARANQPRAGYKWRCVAYGKLHDYPGQCRDQSQGGAWERDPNSPQPPAADDYFEAELRVRKLKAKVAEATAKYSRDAGLYLTRVTQFNTLNDQLTAQIPNIPKPQDALKNVRIVYDENAPRPDPAKVKMLDKMMPLEQLGDGQCAVLVERLANVGLAKDWKASEQKVKDTANFTPMTPAATFFEVDGKLIYPNKPTGKHAVIVLDKTSEGLLVFDQYTGKPPSIHMIKFKGGAAAHAGEAGYKPSRDADNYYYITNGQVNPP